MVTDRIIHGDTLTVLKDMPSESIDCVITSPPYWGLRSYSTNGQVWGGSSECNHEWGTELPARGKSNWDTFDEHRKYPHNGGPMSDTKAKAGVDVKHGAYCQICNAWRGELGLEPTFSLYIEHLQTIFDEVYRVLKKTGTCWVDIGDTYASTPRGKNSALDKVGDIDGSKHDAYYRSIGRDPRKQNNPFIGLINQNTQGGTAQVTPKPQDYGNVQMKSLCNIPFRFAISMTDNGWIQRNTIIWHKPSCMPSSAKDRFTVDFEYVFLFTKNKKYYFEQQFEAQQDIGREQLFEAQRNGIKTSDKDTWIYKKFKGENIKEKIKDARDKNCQHTMFLNLNKNQGGFKRLLPNGRNKRTVWRINPQPFKDAHFAVFPEKLVEPMIKAGCPGAICDSCGYVYTPIQTPTGNRIPTGHPRKSKRGEHLNTGGINGSCFTDCKKNETVLEYIKCNCDAPTHAGIVLDPFVGSGTTALVARKLQRHYIGIDLNEDYVTMANKRLSEVL